MENDDNITLVVKQRLFIGGVPTAKEELQKKGLSSVKIGTYPLLSLLSSDGSLRGRGGVKNFLCTVLLAS